MRRGAALATAWRAVVKNILRSLLATLGILIAVAAVVATVTLGAGAQERVAQDMAALGTNLLFVRAGSNKAGGASGGAGTGRPLTLEDGRAIAHDLGHLLEAWAPLVHRAAQVVFNNANWSCDVVGTNVDYLRVRRWQVADGIFFTPEEDVAAAKVCVLGTTVAERLFGDRGAVGATIRVQQMPCRVAGVLARKGQTGWGQDQDDVVLMPLGTLRRRLFSMPTNKGLIFQLAATSAEAALPLQEGIGEVLRQRHHLDEGQDDDFTVFNFSEIQQSASQQMRTGTLLLGAVALISLIVGAIGITNVMLVSVTERTREIGIRMAVGARRGDILAQFLVESALLAAVGGSLGVCLGLGGSLLGTRAMGWGFLVPWPVVMGTPLVAAATGILAGFYPALRASRLDPIEALRFE